MHRLILIIAALGTASTAAASNLTVVSQAKATEAPAEAQLSRPYDISTIIMQDAFEALPGLKMINLTGGFDLVLTPGATVTATLLKQ